ncbi:SMC family ATPase [Desulfosporosinus sp. PR]|uniref:SMC family ATPase n=1 Tax=Candidatus Desulfosporosinus nitrosoreducens TaxID=3401928 RepID=UPI0027EF3E31|nr:SMC family ATPase [Desulfosporosinus sp. PR]MDQ7094177.1 SMC family ATPase [Desulfosporosinus sp. PR]
MRPLTMDLSNFRSYLSESIELTALKVALINGRNGYGKSTLIDAITFPLFGRGSADKIDDYVTLGRTDMSATLSFELGGNTYRVIRGRTTNGRGKSNLELQQLIDGEWVSKSGATAPETEDRIKKLLRMDYEGFIASAFVVQGEADKFSKQKPAERKETLANILGLDAYSDLEAQAKEKAKGIDIDLKLVNSQVQDLESRTFGKSLLEEKLAEDITECSKIEGLVKEKENDLNQLIEKRARLQTSELRAKDIDNQIVGIQKETQGFRNQISILEKKITEAGDLKSQVPAFEKRISDAEKLTANKDKILENAEEAKRIRDRISELDNTAASHSELQLERSKVQNEATKIEGMIRQEKSKVESNIQNINLQIKNATQQAQPLEGLNCQNPTCQLIIGAVEARDKLPELNEQLAAEKTKLESESYALELWKQKDDLTSKLMEIDIQIEVLDYDPKDHQSLKAKLIDLERYERLVPSLETAEETKRLAQEQIDQIHKTIIEKQDSLKEQIGQLNNSIKEKQDSITGLELNRISLEDEAKEATEVSQSITNIESVIHFLRDKIGIIQSAMGATKKSLEEISQLEIKLKELRTQQNELAADLRDWIDITKACGKNGIQAVIVENSIPEIEREANNLLARMSNGRFSLELITQKPSKTAKVTETLDIKISDSGLGIRPYETYSGAEKMMIDLAIRISLSKLLTRRAGATIRTLVLDETSSALDAQNRSQFLQIVNTLKEDFDLILVISHQEDVQDAFDQRIEIYRTDEGSKARVIA